MAAPKTIAANAYRHRNRRAWIESQGGRCAVCGSTDSLEVDHKDPAEKEISPTYLWVMGPNNPRRIAELAKCQVLCVGCHRGKSGREISAMKVQWHSENREQHSERMRHWHAERRVG